MIDLDFAKPKYPDFKAQGKKYNSGRYYLSGADIALILNALSIAPYASDSSTKALELKLRGAHKGTGSANPIVQAASIGMFSTSNTTENHTVDLDSIDFDAINKELGL